MKQAFGVCGYLRQAGQNGTTLHIQKAETLEALRYLNAGSGEGLPAAYYSERAKSHKKCAGRRLADAFFAVGGRQIFRSEMSKAKRVAAETFAVPA